MSSPVVERLDKEVQDFAMRTRFFHEPMTPGRARNFVRQHRLNTRQRNSVLKLKVATNCPIWEIRLRIIDACSQEIIGDHEHGGGRAHHADRHAHGPGAPDAPDTPELSLIHI